LGQLRWTSAFLTLLETAPIPTFIFSRSALEVNNFDHQVLGPIEYPDVTFNNLGTNSATTKDWLEAMKNQSSSCAEPSHTGGQSTDVLPKEHSEDALKRRVVPVEPKARKKD